MATTLTVDNDGNSQVAEYIDTAGGGTSKIAKFPGALALAVQRISGTGTYTVEGSLDGVKWGALPTALAAVNDDVIHVITGTPLYVRVVIAAAAATVRVVGIR